MHTPKINAENDISTLHRFIREHPLCALVIQTEQGVVASHIPMVLHAEDGGLEVLRGHVARVNTQWKDFIGSQACLGIFTGPQHYVSASWYHSKAIHGQEVPTWNYVAVHAYGTLRAVEDPAWLLEHLRTLTDANEVIAEVPWKVADAPADFISKLSRRPKRALIHHLGMIGRPAHYLARASSLPVNDNAGCRRDRTNLYHISTIEGRTCV